MDEEWFESCPKSKEFEAPLWTVVLSRNSQKGASSVQLGGISPTRSLLRPPDKYGSADAVLD